MDPHPHPDAALGRSDIETLLAARRHCRIAHHVPGRLRLRFDPLALQAAPRALTGRLQAALTAMAGVRRTEINAAAFSVTVHYDAAVLAPALWDRILTGDAAAAAAALGGVLPGAVPSLNRSPHAWETP